MSPQSKKADARRLIILADGGSLADLNDRLASEEAAKRKDFSRIPDAIVKALESDYSSLECPIESRVFCTVGSEKAQPFLNKMGEAWTVKAFPLSFAKYDRAGDGPSDKHRFRLRFHAYLGYAIGLLASASRSNGGSPIVALVTDDPHLLPCLSDARARGLDVRMVWWQSSISDEVLYLAARNSIEPLLLPVEEVPAQTSQRRDLILDQLFAGGITSDSPENTRGRFRLVAFDEGGEAGTADNLRLVCRIQGGGKLAIWGKAGARRNIDAVLKAGMPCTVECQYRAPNDTQATKFGHTHWVREDFELKIVR